MADTPADTSAGQAGELVLVRHGETAWSKSGQHTSFTDVELTKRGTGEAALAGTKLEMRKRPFAAVFTSPMRRARDTCRIAGLDEHAVVTDDLCEWNYGEYEGLTTPQIRETNPGWTIFTGDPPGGETAAQVGERADHIIERAVDAAVGGDVALFSHGHFLRVLGARWIGLAPTAGARLRLDTATICVLGYEHGNRVLHVWNA